MSSYSNGLSNVNYRHMRGYKPPFKEVLSSVKYAFPKWESMITNDNESYILSIFLQEFKWDLDDFVKEYASYRV